MNIYVGNLSYQAEEGELRQLFETFGEVVKVTIIRDRDTGRSKGFGFIEMANEDEGSKAIKELDQGAFLGRNVKVNEARPRNY